MIKTAKIANVRRCNPGTIQDINLVSFRLKKCTAPPFGEAENLNCWERLRGFPIGIKATKVDSTNNNTKCITLHCWFSTVEYFYILHLMS